MFIAARCVSNKELRQTSSTFHIPSQGPPGRGQSDVECSTRFINDPSPTFFRSVVLLINRWTCASNGAFVGLLSNGGIHKGKSVPAHLPGQRNPLVWLEAFTILFLSLYLFLSFFLPCSSLFFPFHPSIIPGGSSRRSYDRDS